MLKRPKVIPSSSGVYFFKDRRGKKLYIGKAANLKSRLSAYFQKTLHEPRLTKMLENAVRVDWQETSSEIEALILESQLIKKNRPPFNIMLRDDKQYFYVVITKEKFSKVFISHQPQGLPSDLSSKVLTKEEALVKEGPFTAGTALRTTLKLLRRIFPYCTCRQTHYRRCLNAHLEKCLGYCCLKSRESRMMNHELREYGKNITSLKAILSGKKTVLVKNLEKEMKEHAAKEDFQKAMELRDKIAKLNQVFANAKIIKEIAERDDTLDLLQKIFDLPALPQRIEGYDIANIQGQFATGSMVVFTNGQPDKNEYRKFKIRRILSSKASREGGRGDTQMLKEVLQRRFNHPEWSYPDLIIVDGGRGQLNAAQAALSESRIMNHASKIKVLALTKNTKHQGDHIFLSNKKEPIALQKLPPSVSNLILQVDSEAHRFAINYYRRLHRHHSLKNTD